MSDFGNNDLRRLDLTVLLVFLGMLRHRRATDVAADLGLTQSGISQALKRLRDIFGDELFLRRQHGMEPTAIALSLEAPITAAVESLREALSGARPFVPAAARGVIRLAALDAEQIGAVPALVRVLSQEAPGLSLSVLPIARRSALDALTAGDVDLALGYFPTVGESMIASPLCTQGFAVIGRPEVIGPLPLTLERYADLPHVLVSPGGDLLGVVDDALAICGLSRRVVAAVPQFFPALAAVAETGCIATLPERLARRYASTMGLVVTSPPLKLPSFTVSALRHRRNKHDPKLLWLLEQIAPALALQLPRPHVVERHLRIGIEGQGLELVPEAAVHPPEPRACGIDQRMQPAAVEHPSEPGAQHTDAVHGVVAGDALNEGGQDLGAGSPEVMPHEMSINRLWEAQETATVATGS
jgi:DNA-binding transcriptional LysR family regulator